MSVEREIAGFALPFAAGVFATAYAGMHFCMDSSLASHYAFAIIFASVSILSSGWKTAHYKKSDLLTRILIAIAASGCGVLSGTTGMSLNIELPPTAIERLASDFGHRMQETIDAIPFKESETGALTKALLTGEKSSLSTETINIFRTSGASHILALSGLHLGIIYLIISKVSSILGNGPYAKRLRSVIIICLCGFYTLATGAGASIVRAFLFILLGETARLTGRYHSLGQIFFASLILQLTISPLSACSISFQLSYAAMAGITFIFPWINGLCKAEADSILGKIAARPLGWIWQSAALSISCQLTTGPLAFLYFGSIPTHFILTNLIGIPLTGIIIPCAILTMTLCYNEICPEFLIQLTEVLCEGLIWSLGIISTM